MRALRWLAFPILAAGLFALSQVGGSYAQPGPKEKGEKGDKAKEKGKALDKASVGPLGPAGRAGGPLREAYNGLRDLVAQPPTPRTPSSNVTEGLLALAKDLYRNAVKAQQDGDVARSRELALAANDAVHGLLLIRRGSLPATTDIPAPPLTSDAPPPPPVGGPDGKTPPPPPADIGSHGEPWVASRELLRHTRERIDSVAELTPEGPGKRFVDASRQVYELSRQAYLANDYFKAIDLAEAADAWTHVGEHLQNAAGGGVAPPRGTPAEAKTPHPPPPVE